MASKIKLAHDVLQDGFQFYFGDQMIADYGYIRPNGDDMSDAVFTAAKNVRWRFAAEHPEYIILVRTD